MKEGFRQSMAWLHTWGGLVTGWVLFFVFLTGTAGYVDTELDRWMRPEKPLVAPEVSQMDALVRAVGFLEQTMPDAKRWLIAPPGGREQPELRYFAEGPAKPDGTRGKRIVGYLNPETGEKVQYRETGGGRLLYRMHWRLHYMPTVAAEWIVGFCAMAMLVALITGVITHARIFKDFFTFRPGKAHRSWLDAHNLLGVLSLPYFLMITYSGLLFICYLYMAPVIASEYGWDNDDRRQFTDMMFSGYLRDREEPPMDPAARRAMAPLAPMLAETESRWGPESIGFVDIKRPGAAGAKIRIVEGTRRPSRDRGELFFDGVTGQQIERSVQNPAPRAISETLLGLHEGLFAGHVLRGLYFLAGLLGTAMIGTGLILWTKKRRARLEGQHGFALVERLNLATVCGLPVGIAGYLWANRLLPVDLAGRAAWEADVMFIAWGVMALHAAVRRSGFPWAEQCWAAAAAFALVPLVNLLTTDRHLGASISAGQWDLAVIDLGCLGFGLGFTVAARIAGRRHQKTVRSARPSTTVPEAAE
ncbi:MAG: PepSY-associated TM helix domain-containing protein [Rhodospirillales bacterium]